MPGLVDRQIHAVHEPSGLRVQEDPEAVDRQHRGQRQPPRASQCHLLFDARGRGQATAAALGDWSLRARVDASSGCSCGQRRGSALPDHLDLRDRLRLSRAIC